MFNEYSVYKYENYYYINIDIDTVNPNVKEKLEKIN
jgi:hypothetical protein